MSDDKTPKPEPPTVPRVLVAHGAMFEALARLPDARNRADRDAIHDAIGRSHRTLMEAASYRDPVAMSAGVELHWTMGRQISAAMDYTIDRIRQFPTLNVDAAAACAGTLVAAAAAWGNLGLLLDMGGPRTAECNAVRELAEECQQAYDGWRAKQPVEAPTWVAPEAEQV